MAAKVSARMAARTGGTMVIDSAVGTSAPNVDYGPWIQKLQGPRMSELMRVRTLVLAGAIVACGTSALAQPSGRPSKRDAALRTPPSAQVHVIITTSRGATSRVADGLRRRGRAVAASFGLIDAVSANVNAADLDALDADPSVTGVSLDAPVFAGAD